MKKNHRSTRSYLTATGKNNIAKDAWLDSQDVMQLLHISHRTLYNLRKSGKLPYYKLCGKILFKESEVNAMVELCRVIH